MALPMSKSGYPHPTPTSEVRWRLSPIPSLCIFVGGFLSGGQVLYTPGRSELTWTPPFLGPAPEECGARWPPGGEKPLTLHGEICACPVGRRPLTSNSALRVAHGQQSQCCAVAEFHGSQGGAVPHPSTRLQLLGCCEQKPGYAHGLPPSLAATRSRFLSWGGLWPQGGSAGSRRLGLRWGQQRWEKRGPGNQERKRPEDREACGSNQLCPSAPNLESLFSPLHIKRSLQGELSGKTISSTKKKSHIKERVSYMHLKVEPKVHWFWKVYFQNIRLP